MLLGLALRPLHVPALAAVPHKLVQVVLHFLALNELEQRLHTSPLKCFLFLLNDLTLDFPAGRHVCKNTPWKAIAKYSNRRHWMMHSRLESTRRNDGVQVSASLGHLSIHLQQQTRT